MQLIINYLIFNNSLISERINDWIKLIEWLMHAGLDQKAANQLIISVLVCWNN